MKTKLDEFREQTNVLRTQYSLEWDKEVEILKDSFNKWVESVNELPISDDVKDRGLAKFDIKIGKI